MKRIAVVLGLFVAVAVAGFAGVDSAKTADAVKDHSSAQMMAQPAKMSQLSWLIGRWEADRKGGGVIGEAWSKGDSVTFGGIGYRTRGTDTIITERTRLLQTARGLFFVADVSTNDSSAWFRLTQADSNGFLFENPAHDFPTKVCYRPVGEDSLAAWIEGPSKDGPKRIPFLYRRVK